MCRYTLPVVCLCLHCHQNEAPLVNWNSLRKVNSGCWRVFFILEFELLVISAWQIPVSDVSDTEELGSSYYTGNAMRTGWQLLAMQTRPGSRALPVNFQPVSTVSCTKLFWFCHLNGSVKEPNKFNNYETEKITRKASDMAEYNIHRVVWLFHQRWLCHDALMLFSECPPIYASSCMTISGGRTEQLDIFCRVTGFTGDRKSVV